MSDLISRQDAINAIEKHYDTTQGVFSPLSDYEFGRNQMCETAINELEDLKSPPIKGEFDRAIESLNYAIECVKSYKNIVSSGNCNTCTVENCGHKPKWGELVRYNCFLYRGEDNAE